MDICWRQEVVVETKPRKQTQSVIMFENECLLSLIISEIVRVGVCVLVYLQGSTVESNHTFLHTHHNGLNLRSVKRS